MATNISRRKFLEASATGMALAAAGVAATGCSDGAAVQEIDGHEAPQNMETEGKWVTAACWHNCGGRCMNKVYVKDGAVVRQKTDDTHEDSFDYPQQRGCVRGKTQQQQCFGADRILHPMKRKGWQPGGGDNSNGQMRGKDEWEVISWDEAIDLSCQEIKRISDQYGPSAFYNKAANTMLNELLGGYVRGWDTTSHGTYTLDTTLIGMTSTDTGGLNDRFDMKNADYVIMWASNPTWSAAGTPIDTWINAHESGTKFICVDPLYNASAQMLDADWYPVMNGTDMALMLATAYEMLRLDEEEGDIIDWDFLHNCTVGFDAESMPADASVNENLKDYIQGVYDNTPKTPEWAEPLCGIPAEKITDLARILGKNNNVYLTHNYGFARCNGAEMVPQMFMALGAMGGHMGKPGNACSGVYHANAGNAGPRLVTAGSHKSPAPKNSINTGVRQPQMYKIIVNGGGHTQDVSNAYGMFHAPNPTDLGPIKAIFHISDATLQTSLNQKEGIEAHRTVDFVLSCAQFMTTNARYSDIILPVTTEWERVGRIDASNREFIVCASQVTDPLGEAKTDQEIGTLLLQGMGKDPSTVYDCSEKQAFFDAIAGCKVMGENNQMGPLVTITDSDISDWGVTGTAQTGVIDLNDFIENGGYQFPRHDGDQYNFIGYQDFVADPVANPLKTSASGKLEIYCQKRYDLMMSFGFPNSDEYKPYPTWIENPCVGYQSTFADGKITKDGAKGDYPFIMYNPHYLRRSHTVFDNCPWLREAWANPIFMSPTDAESLGISDGDDVLLSTPHGQGVRQAAVIEVMRPGVIGVPHGAWVDVDENTGIDMAGSDNYLIGDEYGGMGVSGYNNQICNVEKWTGDAIPADCDKAPRWSGDMDSSRIAPVPETM